MISKMDEVFKKVLNDNEIFYRQKVIFNKNEWKDLRKLIKDNKKDEFIRKIDDKIKELERQHARGKAIELCNSLKSAMENKQELLNQILDTLDDFAVVKSHLPKPSSMDDYGKVIERYEFSTVDQFFIDKIKKEYYPKYGNYSYQGKALMKVLEYTKELYNSNFSTEEIAYFTRKLNSLETYWEVLK